MNRKIKFRAWDKKKKRMLGEFNLMDFYVWRNWGLDSAEEFMEVCKNTEVMQYTGLLDKHGKEIYEGDIDERGVIVIVGNEYGQVSIKRNDIDTVFHELWDTSEKEIIGNVYENPELVDNAK